MSSSNKVILCEEGVVGTCEVEPVGLEAQVNSPDFWLVSEAETGLTDWAFNLGSDGISG